MPWKSFLPVDETLQLLVNPLLRTLHEQFHHFAIILAIIKTIKPSGEKIILPRKAFGNDGFHQHQRLLKSE
jgi:hypothetical protein